MREPKLNAEQLKELVGAPLTSADGSEYVRELSGSDATVDELAAEAVAAIEAARGPVRKYSTNERPMLHVDRRRTSYYVLALVVLIAAIVWTKVLHRPPPVASDPVELVAVLSPIAARSPALAPEWSAVRGVSDSLSELGRAVRVGALLVELERAALRADTSSQAPGDAIAALITEQPDGAETAALFAGGNDGARTKEARHALAPFVRAAPMGIGGWLQAARVATAAQDAGFFKGAKSRETRAALLAMPGVSPEVQAARDKLNDFLTRRGRPNYAALSDVLEILQRELAN